MASFDPQAADRAADMSGANDPNFGPDRGSLCICEARKCARGQNGGTRDEKSAPTQMRETVGHPRTSKGLVAESGLPQFEEGTPHNSYKALHHVDVRGGLAEKRRLLRAMTEAQQSSFGALARRAFGPGLRSNYPSCVRHCRYRESPL
jgi:hypothetical protein